MIDVSIDLPNAEEGIALIFVVGNQRYAGHYHKSGWFYCDERTGASIKRAYGPDVPVEKRGNAPGATHWEYLRQPEPNKFMQNFKEKMAAEKARRTAFFTAGDDISERCASLDLLTPLHNLRFQNQLSEGEQILLYSIVEMMAHLAPGSTFSASDVPVNGRQNTRSHVSAVLYRLVEKRVLVQEGKMYRLLNPGFEIWMRARSLGIRGYAPFFNAICPVLLHDDQVSPQEFWETFCQQAGAASTDIPPTRRQSRLSAAHAA